LDRRFHSLYPLLSPIGWSMCSDSTLEFVAIAFLLFLISSASSATKISQGLHAGKIDPLNPNITHLEPQFFRELGSKRVVIRYGPFMAPGASTNNGMDEFLEEDSQKPCDECLITYMKAGLEYPDGSNANADTGMWLHHGVFLDTGAMDTVCPTMGKKQRPRPNRFFASGNERSPVNLCVSG
jgi:hypothetical protein